MYQTKRILVVVPARGGSKGVRLKNIHPLQGLPLLAWTGKIVAAIGWIDRAVVSTDHEEIARIARDFHLDAPFMRPQELSGDLIGDWEVLHHALCTIETLDRRTFDIVIMLQPTSPLRTVEHVIQCVETMVRNSWDSVWTVSPTDLKYHPLKQLVISKDGELSYFDERGSTIIARQQLVQTYHRNGAVYAISRDCLIEQKRIMGGRCGAVVIGDPMISIDTIEDFQRVEEFLKKRKREASIES